MRQYSLTARLLFATALILVIFLSLTGYALDKAYRASVLTAVEERLQNHVFTLIAVAEFDRRGGIFIPQVMPVSRYFQIDDGLYARIVRHSGELVWQSVSFNSLSLPIPEPVPETQSRFVITIPREKQSQFLKVMEGNPVGCVGKVLRSEKFVIIGLDGQVVVESDIESLKQSWQRPLDW